MADLTTRMLDTLAWIESAGPLRVGRHVDPMRDRVGARTAAALEARGLIERQYIGPGAGKVATTRLGRDLARQLARD
ncbi:hypothetical protein GCM10025867_51000 (plasmid) [Frondihabitans sucicola]|uniref:ArsR family transcriptional regulator n=1 Tax=Frondihabitans sucicola TaxID=1268041 RepID=A0ABM8GV22_9MICO|nr:hypothetical protein [Frondihabitans sucicola]BDZ52293.1 hypothetical protein GCM10025867_45340 [Frondihabitans sucicola]BDZ52859.1 hypothetical protein GCM10025867_51000 [Frondihabitans sucicola]